MSFRGAKRRGICSVCQEADEIRYLAQPAPGCIGQGETHESRSLASLGMTLGVEELGMTRCVTGPILAKEAIGGGPMVRIDLEEQQAAVLGQILEDYISDVRMQIANTDSQEFRDDLKQREAIAKELLGRLARPVA